MSDEDPAPEVIDGIRSLHASASTNCTGCNFASGSETEGVPTRARTELHAAREIPSLAAAHPGRAGAVAGHHCATAVAIALQFAVRLTKLVLAHPYWCCPPTAGNAADRAGDGQPAPSTSE